jgi:hypothetical protein
MTDLLAEHAAVLKRMIAELEHALGVNAAYPITAHMLAALQAAEDRLAVTR